MSADNERSRRMSIKVKYRGDYVGTLALTADRRVAFSYDMSWIKNGFSISPFHLPLKDKVFVPVKNFNDGLLEYLRTVCRMRGENYCLTGLCVSLE